jgi:hypothetical protein
MSIADSIISSVAQCDAIERDIDVKSNTSQMIVCAAEVPRQASSVSEGHLTAIGTGAKKALYML